MFSMMENSQMRENMLLQYADDIIKVEMGSLRAELLRLVRRTEAIVSNYTRMSGRTPLCACLLVCWRVEVWNLGSVSSVTK